MNESIYKEYVNNISQLSKLSKDQKVTWQKDSKNSYYLEVNNTDGSTAIISIQKISGSSSSMGILAQFHHGSDISEYSDNYIFQIKIKGRDTTKVYLATKDLNKDRYSWLHQNIPVLYKDVEHSFERRGADYFNSLMQNIPF